MALSTMAVFGSAFFTPIVVGKIADTIGWKWSFYFVAIISGALLPVLFFFCPETAFVRNAALNTDITGHTRNQLSEAAQPLAGNELSAYDRYAGEHELKEPAAQTTQASSSSSGASSPHNTSYIHTLSPFNGRKSNENYFKLLLRPIPLFLQPSVLWACLTQGVLIGWTVLIGIVLAAIFLSPPLYWTATKVGYSYTSAFIGALIGFIMCGLLSDFSAKWLMKRNGGVYEPEFRIVLVIPQLLFGCGGLYAFGWTAGDIPKYHWLGSCVAFAFVTCGMVHGAVASSLYLVDAHRDIAIETFTCMMIFKNIFSFALTFKGYDWIVQSEPKKVFTAVASVQVGICALSVFMYVFGKWERWWFSRHDLLGMLGLR